MKEPEEEGEKNGKVDKQDDPKNLEKMEMKKEAETVMKKRRRF